MNKWTVKLEEVALVLSTTLLQFLPDILPKFYGNSIGWQNPGRHPASKIRELNPPTRGMEISCHVNVALGDEVEPRILLSFE